MIDAERIYRDLLDKLYFYLHLAENKPVKKPETKDIWVVEDVEEGAAFEDIYDTRPVPE